MAQDWDWSLKESAGDIVVPSVDAIAVYQNQQQDVVIRQQNSLGEDDHVIIIPKSNVRAVIKALQASLKA